MKIQIRADGRNVCIGFPTGLVFSKPSAWLCMKTARMSAAYTKRYMPEDIEVSVSSIVKNIPEESVYALCDELRRMKRIRGSWELVHVESSDGSQVMITL